MTLHQVHRLVQLALGATAVGFAALAGTFRKSAAKKPLGGGQLGNAGPKVAFGGREFGADEGLGHILYHILYKIGLESKSKNAIRICSSLASGLKHQWNQMIWRAKELGCGIAGNYLITVPIVSPVAIRMILPVVFKLRTIIGSLLSRHMAIEVASITPSARDSTSW